MMKKILVFLSSPVLALWLLVFIAVLLAAGAVSLVNSGASFFTSWTFLVVAALLTVNLLFCTVKQLARCFGDSTDTVRRKWGRWGASLFHVGLLIVCIGAFMQQAFSFNGRVGLVAGEMFDDKLQSYRAVESGPLYRHKDGEFQVFLHSVEPRYNKKGVSAGGDISLLKDGQEAFRAVISAGKPLRFGIWHLHLENFGYFAETRFHIENKDYPLDIGLTTSKYNESEKYAEMFNLEGTPYRLEVEFIPDQKSYFRAGQKSYRPDDPALKLRITRIEPGSIKQVFSGLVNLGGSARFDRDATVRFAGFHPWVTFNAKKEPGLYLIYLGFLISLGGAALIYLTKGGTR